MAGLSAKSVNFFQDETKLLKSPKLEFTTFPAISYIRC